MRNKRITERLLMVGEYVRVLTLELKRTPTNGC